MWYTVFNDKESCHLANDTCHYEKKNCQRKRTKEEGDSLPLYNHLKEMRARLGVNQAEMGRLIGTSRQTVSQIERGDYSPSVTLALKIAKVCNVKVEDIFEYEEDNTDEES